MFKKKYLAPKRKVSRDSQVVRRRPGEPVRDFSLEGSNPSLGVLFIFFLKYLWDFSVKSSMRPNYIHS